MNLFRRLVTVGHNPRVFVYNRRMTEQEETAKRWTQGVMQRDTRYWCWELSNPPPVCPSRLWHRVSSLPRQFYPHANIFADVVMCEGCMATWKWQVSNHIWVFWLIQCICHAQCIPADSFCVVWPPAIPASAVREQTDCRPDRALSTYYLICVGLDLPGVGLGRSIAALVKTLYIPLLFVYHLNCCVTHNGVFQMVGEIHVAT